MRNKILHSFYASLEWRIIAFVITNIFLWINTGSLLTATGLSLMLHAILLIAHMLWFFLRHEIDNPRAFVRHLLHRH
ncbi:MAG: hypothetical protein ACJKTH_00640 [Patescibacteria group bacterium UBA2163]